MKKKLPEKKKSPHKPVKKFKPKVGLSKLPLEKGSMDDKAGLESVMASLGKILDGKEFLSDLDLDAFLDSKMATGEIPPSMDLDPLDEAQSLIYEAWNTEGPEKIRLARRALELSEDCGDAYIILAEEDAKSLIAARDLYHKGMQAAKRALDPTLFKNGVGHFWGIMETRPFMRAKFGYAECLSELGKYPEAMTEFRELLRLNPGDNQGVRYLLIQRLLESGGEGELGELLERYHDDVSAEFRYTHALWMFRHEGKSERALQLLTEAIECNSHVPAYLMRRKKLPKEIPDSLAFGSIEEAVSYAVLGINAWHGTLGALDWLATHSKV